MSAPNIKEIDWAISELKQTESSFDVYAKLADLLTVRNELLGMPMAPAPQMDAYSETMPVSETLDQYGDSEFLRSVAGKDPAEAWQVMDELMDTLMAVNRKVYDSVMRKLNRL